MGAARRRLRREAREAATQLLRAGLSVNTIGRMTAGERYKRVLDKVVDAMERKLDTGEGPVSVREGLMAIKEARAIELQQAEAAGTPLSPQETADSDAAQAKAEAAHTADAESREGEGPERTSTQKPKPAAQSKDAAPTRQT